MAAVAVPRTRRTGSFLAHHSPPLMTDSSSERASITGSRASVYQMLCWTDWDVVSLVVNAAAEISSTPQVLLDVQVFSSFLLKFNYRV
jgi:hypothetical protein